MATVKKSTKKKIGWRASKGNPDYTELGLRASTQEATLIQQASEKEAARLKIPHSRNNYCLRAVLAVAEKEMAS